MAEGGGLLNRYRTSNPVGGSNPPPSATTSIISIIYWLFSGLTQLYTHTTVASQTAFPATVNRTISQT